MIKTLKRENNTLSNPSFQVELLEKTSQSFSKQVSESGYPIFRADGVEILQINLGKMCNQTCKHCHVDAGPDRKEIMGRETMLHCLDAIENSNIKTVDLTGGAPEMNPHFFWFVEELTKLGVSIMVRCNLTIILANPKYHVLPEFFKQHKIEVISSLPYFAKSRTDAQRGNGVFDKSIHALRLLNQVGYGKEDSGLTLNLVYNPSGAFLPPAQSSLERDFKNTLNSKYGIVFNNLFAITNMPISRFLDYLIQSGNYDEYMQKLIDAFNPEALSNVMCRNTLSVGWDGFLFDCDFNQMLDMKVSETYGQHIRDFKMESLGTRKIQLNQHCYGCTAGAGSSCGGEIV